jgi:hypothetical protein
VVAVAKTQREAAVQQAMGMHALADTGFVHQLDRALFQHTGADAAEHIVGAALFEHDGVDAGLVQQGPEQQA